MLRVWKSFVEWRPRDARRRILSGRFASRMRVAGRLNLSNLLSLKALPAQLSADSINVSGCSNLRALPVAMKCAELILQRSGVEHLPSGLRASQRVDAEGCRRLRTVGAFQVEELVLRGCTRLQTLFEGLRARRLDVSRCLSFDGELPESIVRSVEHLDVSDCPGRTSLPNRFSRLQGLNVSGCTGLCELSAGLRVHSWIDVAGSGLRGVPWSLGDTHILWRGVPVSYDIAFCPESIKVRDILEEPNQAVRSVMLERMGIERFVDEANAAVLDEDQDSGGRRRLLCIETTFNEAIVCIDVRCPSTGKRYLLRVPPNMHTCLEAVAWTAGYRNPRLYRPLVET